MLLSLVGMTAIRARRRDLDDRLFLEAVQALRKTVETREKGILYEHPPADARASGLAHELALLFEARDEEGHSHAPADRDLAWRSRGWSRRSRPPSARATPPMPSSTPPPASPPGWARPRPRARGRA